jgi:predicted nucleic acid-binding protein
MATMDDKAPFVDTNVPVYANVIETPLHEPALAAISAAYRAGRTLWISWQVIREYSVTLTRPQAFAELPTIPQQASPRTCGLQR